jgi:hypothetical protein
MTFYKDYLGVILTEGFKSFCEENKCYWLVSDLASVLMIPEKPHKTKTEEGFIISDRIIKDFKQEGFIVLNILVKNSKAYIKLYRDYKKDDITFNTENLLYSQNYNYTDLKEGVYSFYICLNELNSFTFMLKEEY